MTTENKKYLIYGGVALLVGSLGYFVYNTISNKKPSVVDNSTDDEVLNTTPTPAPIMELGTIFTNTPLRIWLINSFLLNGIFRFLRFFCEFCHIAIVSE